MSVGGFVLTSDYQLAKSTGELPLEADPYEHGLEQFFAEVLSTVHTLKAPWKRAKIEFIFDQAGNNWMRVVNNCFDRYRARYPTFASVDFKDKKIEIPLQAADMVAYRSRRMTGQWVDNDIDGDGFQDSREFTETLFKSVFTHFQQNKAAMFNAYIGGRLSYEYFRKHG